MLQRQETARMVRVPPIIDGERTLRFTSFVRAVAALVSAAGCSGAWTTALSAQEANGAQDVTAAAGQASGIMTWLPTAVTVSIIVAIVACFVYFAYRYLFALRRASKALTQAATRVSGGNDPAQKLFPQGPTRLRDLWDQFLEERSATTLEHEGHTLSTVDPQEIFHDEAIFDTYNRNFAVTLAGFFTGLGILGTFTGLVIGLWNLDASALEAQSESVNSLLAGMSTAFVTSLVGISFSLLWLFLDRALFDAVQRAANNFFLKVRARYPVESADRLLHHLLQVEQNENQAIQESRDLLLEQKGILQSLDSDLAIAFEDVMTKSFEASLTPQLKEMTQAMTDLSVKFADQQVEAMETMVQSFQSNLNEQLHSHLQGLAEALQTAALWQEDVHQQSLELTERLGAATQQQIDLLDAVTTASEGFAESVSNLDSVHGHIRESATWVEKASAEINGVADTITKQAEQLAQQINAVEGEQKVYREANEQLQRQLAEQLDTLDRRMRDAGEMWSGLSEELEDVGKRLQSGANEFSTLTTQKLQEIFARFDSEMATVTKHLSGTIAEVRDVTEDLPRHVGGLTDAMEAHANGLEKANGVGDQLSQRLAHLAQVSDALKRIEPLGQSIANAAKQLERASATFEGASGSPQPSRVDGPNTT